MVGLPDAASVLLFGSSLVRLGGLPKKEPGFWRRAATADVMTHGGKPLPLLLGLGCPRNHRVGKTDSFRPCHYAVSSSSEEDFNENHEIGVASTEAW